MAALMPRLYWRPWLAQTSDAEGCPRRRCCSCAGPDGLVLAFADRASLVAEYLDVVNGCLERAGLVWPRAAGSRRMLPTAIEALRHQDQRVLLRIVTAQHRHYVAELLAGVGSILCRGFLRVS